MVNAEETHGASRRLSERDLNGELDLTFDAERGVESHDHSSSRSRREWLILMACVRLLSKTGAWSPCSSKACSRQSSLMPSFPIGYGHVWLRGNGKLVE